VGEEPIARNPKFDFDDISLDDIRNLKCTKKKPQLCAPLEMLSDSLFERELMHLGVRADMLFQKKYGQSPRSIRLRSESDVAHKDAIQQVPYEEEKKLLSNANSQILANRAECEQLKKEVLLHRKEKQEFQTALDAANNKIQELERMLKDQSNKQGDRPQKRTKVARSETEESSVVFNAAEYAMLRKRYLEPRTRYNVKLPSDGKTLRRKVVPPAIDSCKAPGYRAIKADIEKLQKKLGKRADPEIYSRLKKLQDYETNPRNKVFPRADDGEDDAEELVDLTSTNDEGDQEIIDVDA